MNESKSGKAQTLDGFPIERLKKEVCSLGACMVLIYKGKGQV